MHPLTFTIEDFKTPERMERLFRKLNHELAQPAAAPTIGQPNLQALASSIAPMIRSQLQAPGRSPLNLQSLLPSSGIGAFLTDTHANRLINYSPNNYEVGTPFYETDRTVVYVVTESAGARQWTYAAGMYSTTFANRPTDLGAGDANFLLWVTVHAHVCRWSGATWSITDGGGGYIVDAVAALPAIGWQLCDGTATDYLVVSGSDLAVTAFTTPDENTAPAGVYHESIAAYTGTINAATAPGISGSTANSTATNQAATTGVTVDNAPTDITVDAHSTANDTAVTGAETRVTTANHVINDPQHDHPTTDLGHNHTQDAHLHGAGTLAVDAAGEPRRLGVLRYFRR